MQRLYFVLLVLFAGIVGCASVPKESVELSRLVGEMAASAKSSHITMTNRYFQHLLSRIDDFAVHEYKDTLFANTRKVMKGNDPAFKELTLDQYDRLIERVQQKRNEWARDIEKDRQAVLQALEEHYAILAQANGSVTAFLQSAAKLSQTESALLDKYGTSIGLSGSKMKEFEDKLLASSNRVREIMEAAGAVPNK